MCSSFSSSGFPVKWVGPGAGAAQNNLAVETVEVAHQGLERRRE